MSPSVRSDDLIATYREKFVAGEIELWEFEAGVARALAGVTPVRQPDEWFRLAHERRLLEYEKRLM